MVRDGTANCSPICRRPTSSYSKTASLQTVDSFTRVSHGGGIGVGVAWRVPDRTVAINPTARNEAPAAAIPNEDAATVALVYDHLSSEALHLAQKATLAYLPLTGESPVRIGVFAGEPGPRVVQSYTTERAAVRRAVAEIMPAGVSMKEQKAERGDHLTARRREIDADNARAIASTATATGALLARNGAEMGARETERAPHPDRAQHDALVRQLRSFPERLRHGHGADGRHPVAVRLSGTEDGRFLFRRAAGHAIAHVAARRDHRRGEPRQRDRVRR